MIFTTKCIYLNFIEGVIKFSSSAIYRQKNIRKFWKFRSNYIQIGMKIIWLLI